MNEAAALEDPATPYYDDIVDLLDIALTLSEMGKWDPDKLERPFHEIPPRRCCRP